MNSIEQLLTRDRLHLALSGDIPSAEVVRGVAGVGFVRNEYVLRQAGAYSTTLAGQSAITDYALQIAHLFSPKRVWIRSSDLEAREIATLDGCDADLQDENPILGDRGIRRAQRFPDAFRNELSAIVAAKCPNLGLLFSYVADVAALDFALEQAALAGWSGPTAVMIEIPSAALSIDAFLTRPLSMVLVGLNDLTSLLLGADRRSSFARKEHAMVLSLTRQIIQKTLDAGREVLVGGNFDPVTLKSAAMLPATGLVLHHHELPSLLPGRFESYRDLDVVSEIRSRTALALRNRVHER